MQIKKVIKRDGRVVDFDPNKIKNAIRKAFEAQGQMGDYERITLEVIRKLEQKYNLPHVEQIQDVVEETLMDLGYPDVAKAYILYRHERAEIRKAKEFFGVKDDLKLSLNAIQILRKRYLLKDDRGNVIETPREMFWRVAKYIGLVDALYLPSVFDKNGKQKVHKDPRPEDIKLIKRLGLNYWDIDMLARAYTRLNAQGKMKKTWKGFLKELERNWDKIEGRIREFYSLMVNLEFLPNSPTLMNAGTSLGQLSACFVLPVEDSIVGIFDAVKWMAMVQQSGGGTGFSFSRLRPKGDIVRSTKGIASGPVSFMEVFDKATDVIKQGGKRRGANMGILRVDHPDILEFITAKSERGILQNFNVSVAVTDKFMKAVESGDKYPLINPRTKKKVAELNARDVFEMMVMSAWKSGDPGLIFIDEINRRHPLKGLGRIEATNPCVTGDTRLATHKGWVKVYDLYKKKESLSVTADTRTLSLDYTDVGTFIAPAVPVFKTSDKEDVYLIKTKEGFEIKVTSYHPFFRAKKVGRKYKIEKVELSALKPGDKLLIQSGKGQFGTEGYYTLGLLIGAITGDGFFYKGSAYMEVWDDRDLLEQVRYAFNDVIKREGLGKPIKVIKLKEKNRLKSQRLGRLLNEKYGFPQDTKLKVPEVIWRGKEETVVGYLRGLFSTDGTIWLGKNGRECYVALTSKSLNLLKDVQILLINLGIMSRIYKESRKSQSTFRHKLKTGETAEYVGGETYSLRIHGNNVIEFMKKIGFIQKEKNEKFWKWFKKRNKRPSRKRELFLVTVKSIEHMGKQAVYDTTQLVNHTLIFNGFVTGNCGEVPLLPFESCNLGSINLTKFVKDDEIDWDNLERTVRTAVRFLDNVIDANKYPLPKLEEMAHANRKIGLGVMGWAEMLIMLGIQYDSEKAIELAKRLMKFITETARDESRKLGKERGSFPNFNKSVWKRKYKTMRNATVTTIAPTGSISIIAGCSSSIEPLFAVAFVRNVLEGARLLEVNKLFEIMARKKGVYSKDLIYRIARTGSLQDIPEIPNDLKRLFRTALDINPEWHVKMQAAFQKYVDNAVSKTINLRNDASPSDVKKAFLLAWKLKCKGITVYRYGSKEKQVLYIGPMLKHELEKYVSAEAEFAGGCPGGEKCEF